MGKNKIKHTINALVYEKKKNHAFIGKAASNMEIVKKQLNNGGPFKK